MKPPTPMLSSTGPSTSVAGGSPHGSPPRFLQHPFDIGGRFPGRFRRGHRGTRFQTARSAPCSRRLATASSSLPVSHALFCAPRDPASRS